MDDGQLGGHVGWKPHDPLHAQQVPRSVRLRPARPGRHGVGEGVGRCRMHADLGRQLRVIDQGDHGRGGKLQACRDIGHGDRHV